MIAYLAVAVMAIIFLYTAIAILISKKLKPRSIMALWYTFIITFSVLVLVSEPADPGPDIARIFPRIDVVRRNGNFDTYGGMYVFGLMLWLVAKTPYNQLLQVGTVLAFGFLVGRVVEDYITKESDRYSTKAILIYFWAALGGVSAFQLISNIRTALVCAIWVYCYHFYYKNKKKKLKYYLIMFVALFIHTFTAVLIGLTIVNSLFEKLFGKNKMVPTAVLLFFIVLLVKTPVMPTVLRFTGIPYLMMLARKWTGYMGYTYNFKEFVVKSLPLMFYVPCAIFTYGEAKREHGLMNFTVLVTIAAGGMLIFYQRLLYAIGLFSFSSLNEIATHNKYRVLYLLAAYVSICLQMLFGFHEMFSHFVFNGINFRDMLMTLI